MSLTDEIEVFYGEVTQHSAQVYVRLANLPGGGEWSLAGHIRGPFCNGVRTLPLTATLVDTGVGDTLLAKSAIPDPSTWTPLSPAHYNVTVELRRHGELTECVERRIGVRTLGAGGRNLRWEAKRWVLRGICIAEQAIGELEPWREHNAVPVVSRPSDALLEQASQEGVLLAVELGIDATPADVRRISSFPAVGMAVLPPSCDDAAKLKSLAPNILFAQTMPSKSSSVAEWADFLLCDAEQPDELRQRLAKSALPIVAVRRVAEHGSFLDTRAQCDQLQRDLAAIGDFAGYVV
jgi:hypothetical protein